MTPADQLEVSFDLADPNPGDPDDEQSMSDQDLASLDEVVVPDEEPR